MSIDWRRVACGALALGVIGGTVGWQSLCWSPPRPAPLAAPATPQPESAPPTDLAAWPARLALLRVLDEQRELLQREDDPLPLYDACVRGAPDAAWLTYHGPILPPPIVPLIDVTEFDAGTWGAKGEWIPATTVPEPVAPTPVETDVLLRVQARPDGALARWGRIHVETRDIPAQALATLRPGDGVAHWYTNDEGHIEAWVEQPRLVGRGSRGVTAERWQGLQAAMRAPAYAALAMGDVPVTNVLELTIETCVDGHYRFVQRHAPRPEEDAAFLRVARMLLEATGTRSLLPRSVPVSTWPAVSP
jgi:hypothetical protein